MSLQAELKGVPEAVRALDRFGLGVQQKHVRKALSAAGGVFKREVEKRAPVDTGTLRKYQIVKTKVLLRKGIGYTIIGAKSGVRVAADSGRDKGDKEIARWVPRKDGVLVARGQRKFEDALDAGRQLRYRIPSRYSHLVEKGTKRGVKPSRYLARSIAAGQHQAAKAAVDKLRSGVREEVQKARSR